MLFIEMKTIQREWYTYRWVRYGVVFCVAINQLKLDTNFCFVEILIKIQNNTV